MRDSRRFWNHGVAKCEALVASDFSRSWNRGVAKCSALVAFGSRGSSNARLSSFLHRWSRARVWKCEILDDRVHGDNEDDGDDE